VTKSVITNLDTVTDDLVTTMHEF